MKHWRTLLAIGILTVGLATGLYFSNQRSGTFELRKKAAEIQGSQLLSKGPQKVSIGEKFTVDLVLDTTTDPKYTISGVDVVVSYIVNNGIRPPQVSVLGCQDMVDVLANAAPLKISSGGISYDWGGLKEKWFVDRNDAWYYLYSVDSGVFRAYKWNEGRGLQQNGGVVRDDNLVWEGSRGCYDAIQVGYSFPASGSSSFRTAVSVDPPSSRLVLLSVSPGKIFDSYPTQTPTCVPLPPCVYGVKDERGSISICSLSDKPPGGGEWCPLAGQPELLNPVTISGVKNYSVNDKGYFNGFTGQGIFATLTFVAQNSGKATISFVYKDPSATDDTNVNGFLANQPVSLQKPQERLLTSPQAFTIEVVASQPTPTSSPTCAPRPPCADGIKDASGRLVICDPAPGIQWCPPTPTPTSTPEPRVMINFRLQLEGRKSHASVVDIYGMIKPTNVQPRKEVLQALETSEALAFLQGMRIDKLGTAVTDPSGTGVLSLDRGYVGSSYMLLLAQTPSHLRKAAQNYQAIRLDVGQNPVCRAEICTQEVKYVDFGTLTAGDVYTDEKGNKDNLINTFDVGAVFAAWSGADVVAKSRDTSTFGGILPSEIGYAADLNGDGVVNNRDLAMLLANFNKRGDTATPPSVIKQ